VERLIIKWRVNLLAGACLATVTAALLCTRLFGSVDSAIATDLLRTLHKRPYGSAWVSGAPVESRHNAAVPVSMTPGATPAGAMALLRVGILNDDRASIDAAVDVARGIAAVMQPNGQVPAGATFGASAGGRDPALPVPERAATRAGLAVLLTVIAHQQRDGLAPEERLLSSAKRAANWLVAQQSTVGGWSSSYPPGKPPRESVRLIRLDTEDHRDNTLALLLAGRVLNDDRLLRASRKSVDLLIRMQLQGISSINGRGLWSGAYKQDASPVTKEPAFPRAVHTVASRRALETLVVYALLTDAAADDSDESRALKNAITQASRTLKRQRGADGTWEPAWDPKRGAWQGDNAPVEPEQVIFASTQPVKDPAPAPGTFGLPGLLDMINVWTAQQTGQADTPARSFDTLPLDVAGMLVGLTDLPLGADPADTLPAPTTVQTSAFLLNAIRAWNSTVQD